MQERRQTNQGFKDKNAHFVLEFPETGKSQGQNGASPGSVAYRFITILDRPAGEKKIRLRHRRQKRHGGLSPKKNANGRLERLSSQTDRMATIPMAFSLNVLTTFDCFRSGKVTDGPFNAHSARRAFLAPRPLSS